MEELVTSGGSSAQAQIKRKQLEDCYCSSFVWEMFPVVQQEPTDRQFTLMGTPEAAGKEKKKHTRGNPSGAPRHRKKTYNVIFKCPCPVLLISQLTECCASFYTKQATETSGTKQGSLERFIRMYFNQSEKLPPFEP